MSDTKHTPTPWRTAGPNVTIAEAEFGHYLAHVYTFKGVEGEDNAEHIVRCVNAHDDLLKACKVLTTAFSRLAVEHGLRGDTVLNFPDAGKCQVGDIVACGDAAIVKATKETP